MLRQPARRQQRGLRGRQTWVRREVEPIGPGQARRVAQAIGAQSLALRGRRVVRRRNEMHLQGDPVARHQRPQQLGRQVAVGIVDLVEIANGRPGAAQSTPQRMEVAHQIAPGPAGEGGRERRDEAIAQAGHVRPAGAGGDNGEGRGQDSRWSSATLNQKLIRCD